MKQMLVAVIAATLSVGAIAAGDAGTGKAKAAVCAGCHGMNGKAMVPKLPQSCWAKRCLYRGRIEGL